VCAASTTVVGADVAAEFVDHEAETER
jgi:hypothetical protein